MGGVSGPSHPSRGGFSGRSYRFLTGSLPNSIVARRSLRHGELQPAAPTSFRGPWRCWQRRRSTTRTPRGLTRDRGRSDRRPGPQGRRPGRKARQFVVPGRCSRQAERGEWFPSSPGTCASGWQSHRLIDFCRERERYGFEDVTARRRRKADDCKYRCIRWRKPVGRFEDGRQ